MVAPARRPRLLRMTTIPMALRVLLTGQLGFMQQAGMDVMAVSSPGTFLDELAATGLQTYGVPMPRRVSPLLDMKALGTLIRIMRAERPDIVHTHTPKAGLLGILAAFYAQVPIRIHTYAGAPYDGTRGVGVALAKQADRLTARVATQVWSVGPELSRFLTAERIVKPGEADVIGAGSSNGIDLQALRPSPRQRPGDPPRFIWIGRLAQDKGLEELIALWRLMAQLCPTATLEIVGSDDERDPPSAAVKAALRRDDRIHLVGFQLDIAKRLARADSLLCTSRREGLPGVVLQAQAAGVPVIALRCRGVADALVDGVGGHIYERTAVAEAGHGAIALIQDPVRWQHYRKAGRHFVATHFERRRFQAALLQRYQELLTRHGLPHAEPLRQAA